MAGSIMLTHWKTQYIVEYVKELRKSTPLEASHRS